MQSTQAPDLLASRRSAILARRLAATLIDGCIGLMFVAAAAILAFVGLLIASGIGEREPSRVANSIAFSIVLAAIPAWYGLLAARAWGSMGQGATPGQGRMRLVVEGSRTQRFVRLVFHPLSSVGWWWLAGVASLATVPALPLLLVAMGLLALGGGLISMAIVSVRPSTRALHDQIAQTRMSSR